jgi:hypothetical protein
MYACLTSGTRSLQADTQHLETKQVSSHDWEICAQPKWLTFQHRLHMSFGKCACDRKLNREERENKA